MATAPQPAPRKASRRPKPTASARVPAGMPPQMAGTHLTLAETLTELQCSYETLHRRMKDRVFREGKDYIRYQRRVLFRKDAIDRYLNRLAR